MNPTNNTRGEMRVLDFLNSYVLSFSNLYFLRVNVSSGNVLLYIALGMSLVKIDSVYFSNCFGKFHSLMAFVENSNINILLNKQIVFESCEAEYRNF